MHIGNRSQILLLRMFADDGNQIFHFSITIKNLAFAIDNILLQIDSNCLCHAKILHSLWNCHTQLFAKMKKMINSRTSREDHS